MSPMNPISAKREDVFVIKDDTSVLGPYKATVTSGSIILWDHMADVEKGDIVSRKLPNGKTEKLFITKSTFYNGLTLTPAHYQLEYSNSPPETKSSSASHTINIHGAQAVQIGDFNTQNVINSIQSVISQIDASDASQQEKSEAKSRLLSFIEHPLVVGLLGAAATAAFAESLS